MSDLFAERDGQLFFENGEDYTDYLMLEEQDRVTGYRNSVVALEGGEGNLAPGADANVNNLLKGVDVDDD